MFPSRLHFPVGRTPVFFSLISGVLLSAAFPRLEWWPLAFVGLIPALLVARGMGSREAFICGYLTGLAHQATLLYWLVSVLLVYGNLPLVLSFPIFVLLVGYLAIYTGLFFLGLSWAERYLKLRWGSLLWVCTGAAIFTGLEYFKAFFLTGFNWEPLGAALAPAKTMVQTADIVGAGGLSFILVAVNLSLVSLIVARKHKDNRGFWVHASVAAGILTVMLVYGLIRIGTIERAMNEAPVKTAAVVQGNIDQALKWDPEHRVETMITYRDLTFKAGEKQPWLTVWPETAAPFFYPMDPSAADWMNRMVDAYGRPVLFGAPAFEKKKEETRYFNRAYLLGPKAKEIGYYDKVHLVPFGEYVPMKKYFPFLGKVSDAVGNYEAGPMAKVIDFTDDHLGILICYESIFPELARAHVRAGADYLIVMTNDAWFGYSSAAYQHFSQAIVRAVENRRALIRAANTGISGFILPNGEVQSTYGLFKRGVVYGRMPRLRIQTIYAAVGDIIPQLSFVATLGIFGAALYRRKKHARRPKTAS